LHDALSTISEVEYDVTVDYDSGVFVDSVPIKTTIKSASHDEPSYKKSNRFPDLRRFFSREDRYFQ